MRGTKSETINTTPEMKFMVKTETVEVNPGRTINMDIHQETVPGRTIIVDKSAVSTSKSARPMTLEEIEALPFASVIWMTSTDNDNGVIWHWKEPVVVGAPGKYGVLVGGDENGIIYREISEKTFADPTETYWTQEPDDAQIPGITRSEYDSDPDAGSIIHVKLAEAITGRKVTFRRICELTGNNLQEFMEKMNGKQAFTCGELAAIASALDTTVDEIFSPENVAAQI